MQKQHFRLKCTGARPSPLHGLVSAPRDALKSTQSFSPIRLFYLRYFLWKPCAANTSQMALICSATKCSMLRRVTAWQTTQKSGLCSNPWNKCKYPEIFCYFSEIKIQVKQTYCQIFLANTYFFKRNHYKFISDHKQHKGKKTRFLFFFLEKKKYL